MSNTVVVAASDALPRLIRLLEDNGCPGIHGWGITNAASVRSTQEHRRANRRARKAARRLPPDTIMLFVATTTFFETVDVWEGFPVAVLVRDIPKAH